MKDIILPASINITSLVYSMNKSLHSSLLLHNITNAFDTDFQDCSITIVSSMEGSGVGGKLPWGVSQGNLQPPSLSQISDTKLVTFAVGQQKKSRFQKAREGRIELRHS
jgi:hypothetical protein